jgi:hypothetical protein
LAFKLLFFARNHSRHEPGMPSDMKLMFRNFSLLLLASALVSCLVVLISDAARGFSYDAHHLRLGSLPFVFIGLAFICYQLSLCHSWRRRCKGLLLGLAFALWGSEQFIPPGPWLTALDNLVIAIFVIDLGLIVGGQMARRD